MEIDPPDDSADEEIEKSNSGIEDLDKTLAPKGEEGDFKHGREAKRL
jgi:hypothetical protein